MVVADQLADLGLLLTWDIDDKQQLPLIDGQLEAIETMAVLLAAEQGRNQGAESCPCRRAGEQGTPAQDQTRRGKGDGDEPTQETRGTPKPYPEADAMGKLRGLPKARLRETLEGVTEAGQNMQVALGYPMGLQLLSHHPAGWLVRH